jgi:hypothetical protein
MRFVFLMIVTNLDAKSTTREPFKPIFNSKDCEPTQFPGKPLVKDYTKEHKTLYVKPLRNTV